jgi:ATP-dependent protease ClpP protease subunit
MAKDILIYGRINSETAKGFFDAVDATTTDENSEVVIRIATDGGEPEYGWGISAKISELKNKKIKVDGKAYSYGVFALCYAKKEDIDSLDVAQYMVHRAAYADWFESSDWFTEELKENLKNINTNFEKAFRNRIDVAAFENLPQVKEKGITIKDIFSMDSRIDVFFTAQDAKKIGLIGSITKITPSKQTEINTLLEKIQAGVNINQFEKEVVLTENQNPTDMTIEKLKTDFPTIYSSIFELGVTAGKKVEKDRVGSCLVFLDVDKKEVLAAIEKGDPLTETQKSEFALKAANPKKLAEIEKESPETVITSEAPTAEVTAQEKKVADFSTAVDKALEKYNPKK